MAAFAGYPLLLHGKLIGVLAVFAHQEFSPPALDAMAAVADGVALAVDRTRAEREVARYTRDLEQAHDLQRQNAEQLSALVDQLRVTQRQAEAATRAKSDFLASMSHELRTPLNAIILYSELLQEEAADRAEPASVADLQRIQSSGKHLLELINGILDLSKIEAGKMSLSLETIDVKTMVDDVLDTLGPIVRQKHNTLHRALQSRPGADVRRPDEDPADPAQPAEQRRQVHAGRHDHPRDPAAHDRRDADASSSR